MRGPGWRVRLGAGLLAASVLMLAVHYLIFGDLHHLALYTLHDIAFLPVEVLIVSMILHELLEHRARKERLNKLNMVIGAFFSELGTELLARLSRFGVDGRLLDGMHVGPEWDATRFSEMKAVVARSDFNVDVARGDLASLSAFLHAKREFLLRMLENPSLLEHETFTDALWAIFHLGEELEHRADLTRLGGPDLAHLSGDLKRVSGILATEWFGYLGHLKEAYPYLFSLAVRRNPFDPEARAEIPG